MTGATIAALRRMRLVGPDETPRITALTGGVSSDIHLVETAERRFCVKRALARLRVAALWEVPVGRNAAEAAWMRRVGEWLPGTAPEILGEDRGAGLFAMAYLSPEDHPVWKSELLADRVDATFAAQVGDRLAAIHARSAACPGTASAFAHHATFDDIRIDPYLRATGRAHPDLQSRFEDLASRTRATRTALMHGDVSPKNILVGPLGPVFLDAECACFGDPAFDLAFCLNHLLLKGARHGTPRDAFRSSFDGLAHAYIDRVTWEDAAVLEARAAALLPALFLARIDGTSPVEYLVTATEKDAVRRCAVPLIADPPRCLAVVADAWMGSA